MDEDGARTIATTIGTLYRAVHDQMREHVRGMDHGTLNWKPLPLANSVAVLIVHTLGSEREVIHAVRSVTAERDRDAEDFLLARVQHAVANGERHDIGDGDRLASVRTDVIEAEAG